MVYTVHPSNNGGAKVNQCKIHGNDVPRHRFQYNMKYDFVLSGKSTLIAKFASINSSSRPFGERFMAAQREICRRVSNPFGAFTSIRQDSSPFGGEPKPFGDPYDAELATKE